MPHRSIWTVLLFLTVTGTATALGQTGPPQAPVFRAVVDLVTVDATVVDRDGQPIAGLRPEDFGLKVDNQSRKVVSVQYVARPGASKEAGSTSGGGAASTNAIAADGRLVAIAVDQTNIRRLEGRPALQAASRFIDALGPADRVAVLGLAQEGDIEFSRDRARAKRQVAALTGEAMPALIQPAFNLGLTEAIWIADGNKSRLETAVRRECGMTLGQVNDPARVAGEDVIRPPCPTQLEQEARMVAQQARTEASLTLAALEDLLKRLKTIDGPKTVALLSEGLVAEPKLVDMTVLGALAQDARVAVYVLHMETPTMDITTQQVSPTMIEDGQMRADGLARLAGSAGGALFRLAGSDPGPFQRVLRESSGYYLIAFEATDADRDGRPHQISLSTSRRGATLRSRSAFTVEAAADVRKRTEARLVDLLRTANVATELPLRAIAHAFFDPGTGRVRLEVGAETESDEGLAPHVLFGFVVVDGKGVIAASQVQESLTRRFTATVDVAPGVYTLKVAAIDRLARSGSLPRAVLAGVTHRRLPTSELMVAHAPAEAGAPLVPVIDRVDADRVVAYLELYPEAGASLRDVDVHVSIRPAGGAAPRAMPAAISTRSDRHASARVTLSLQGLAEGRYLVRALITDGGTEVGILERAITIVR